MKKLWKKKRINGGSDERTRILDMHAVEFAIIMDNFVTSPVYDESK